MRGAGFELDGRPFRFVGANVAVTYGEDERERMPLILSAAARDGARVVRVWAFGETDDAEGGPPPGEWLRAGAFRHGPDAWNENAFRHLDRILFEAARNNLRVQICLTNWWPDTGGVTQYLAWAGVPDAYDPRHPHGVNAERAALFYTNDEARDLYRRHVERVVARRNTITGALYRDDPVILGYELMNEGQAPTGREHERRAWVAEMSAFVKSLDPNHLVTPGTWGYRTAFERRAWLEDHRPSSVDYCDVHLYPRDDTDSHITSPDALSSFLLNRAAAARSLGKPLVVGEFGVPLEGFNNISQADWFRAYFASAARWHLGGAMFWILTHVAERPYGVSYADERDAPLRAEFESAARLFDTLNEDELPPALLDFERHLVPHQFAFARDGGDTYARPELDGNADGRLLYRFAPEQAARGRFEKLGSGPGYVWGAGVGFFEYVIPARDDWRPGNELVVRAHLQPTLPSDAAGRLTHTRVRLLVNDTDCGARLVPFVDKPRAHVEEWRVNSLGPRLDAARGLPLRLRFAVEPEADQPFGLTISNFPEGFDARGHAPVELEIK